MDSIRSAQLNSLQTGVAVDGDTFGRILADPFFHFFFLFLFRKDSDVFFFHLREILRCQGEIALRDRPNFLQSFPGFVLLAFLQSFFFTLGISPWVWGAVRTPVFAAGIAANIEAVAAGLAPQYIVTYEVMFTIGLLTLGGQGSPLPLVVMMLRSKSKKLRQFARVTVGPAIFNISEPIMYGLPIVFNPIMMIPMWINPIVGSCLLWVIFRTGLLNIPAISLQTGSLPAPITTVMICQDWRGILWWVVFFVIYAVIWYPFYKAYERQVLAEEAENN